MDVDVLTSLAIINSNISDGINLMVFGLGFTCGCLLLTAFSFWKW